jgi:hypothetical protein
VSIDTRDLEQPRRTAEARLHSADELGALELLELAVTAAMHRGATVSTSHAVELAADTLIEIIEREATS